VRGLLTARLLSFSLATLVFGSGLIFLSSSRRAISPRFVSGSYYEGEAVKPIHLPFRAPAQSPDIDVELNMELGERQAALYRLHSSGCVEDFRVNGVRAWRGSFCDDGTGWLLTLSDFLHPGENVLTFRLRSEEMPVPLHGLDIYPSRMDPFVLSSTISILLLVAGYGWFLLRFFGGKGKLPVLGMLVLIGTLLRFLYLSATPYAARSYDWQGHIEYLRYVADHFSIPPAQLGWETFQPPLYYFLGALYLKAGHALGRPFELLFPDLQAVSFLFSVLTLATGAWMGTMLFKEEEQRSRLLFTGMLAVFPGLLFFAARISNDTLYSLLAFLFLAFLLRWWGDGRERDWITASILLALSLLTKGNALLLLPVLFLCLLLKRGIGREETIGLFLKSLFVIAVLAGWFYLLRFGVEGERFIVGNVRWYAREALFMENSFGQFLVFDPLRIFLFHFNNEFSDAMGRQYFWEYFFRSAFTGQFVFGGKTVALISAMQFMAMALLPATLVGAFRAAREENGMPLLVTVVVLLVGHVLYRVLFPVASAQDFRFSVLVIVPLVFFTIRGIQVLPRVLEKCGLLLLLSFLLASAVLPALLYFYS
jgi:hypothetical protein